MQKPKNAFDNLPKIVAIDFDGCMVDDMFPAIGDPIPEVIHVAKKLRENGVKLILWTSRNDESNLGDILTQALDWCADRDIFFDAVNTNIDEVKELTGADTRKVYADLYIDDKSIPHTQSFGFWCHRLGLEYNDFR